MAGCIVLASLTRTSDESDAPAAPVHASNQVTAAALPPFDGGVKLERDTFYTTSRETPLLQRPGHLPEGTTFDEGIDAIASIEHMPAGGAFQVVDWTDDGDDRWYHVDVWDNAGNQARRYINRGALMGQDLQPVDIPVPATTRAQSYPRQEQQARPNIAIDGDSNSVYVTPTGAKFHSKYCRTLKGSYRPLTRDQATNQGYEACKVCGGS